MSEAPTLTAPLAPVAAATPVEPALFVAPVAFITVGRAGAMMATRLRAAGIPEAALLSLSTRQPGETPPPAPGHCTFSASALDRPGAREMTRLIAVDPTVADQVKQFCAQRRFVLILAGLGGRTGSWITPLVSRAAREAGARVFAFVTLPGREEGGERCHRARACAHALTEGCDGVFALPHESLNDAFDPNGPLADFYDLPARLLADAARGAGRMLTAQPVVRLHPEELCGHVRGAGCTQFASVEAGGSDRAIIAAEKLLAHPLLRNGEAMRHTQVILGIVSGDDLSRTDMLRVTDRLETAAEGLRLITSVGTDAALEGRLSLTAFVLPQNAEIVGHTPAGASPTIVVNPRPAAAGRPEAAPGQPLLMESNRGEPAPTALAVRRRPAKSPQQGQLPLDMLQRGRFDKGEPTIRNGENLDVPTYIRRGISLN